MYFDIGIWLSIPIGSADGSALETALGAVLGCRGDGESSGDDVDRVYHFVQAI